MENVEWFNIIMIIIVAGGGWLCLQNFSLVKRVLIGAPMKTEALQSKSNHLFWLIALPILSADLYSSVAYGPEAGMSELAQLGPDAKWLILPITVAAVLLLAILINSYIMGVLAYPNGGGAYAIARDNFKHSWVAVTASSALLIDYVLTVAVSVSAAVAAIASAYPAVTPYRTTIALICIFVLLLINLRGVAEAAKVLAWPTFFFMACMLALIAFGFFNEFRFGFVQAATPSFGTVPKDLTALLVLKAFSSSCSALTGIETISNSVPIFRNPKQKNAIKTYVALGILEGVTLLGIAYHLYVHGISVHSSNTMLSQLTALIFGNGLIYQLITWSTFVVLILAANSTFNGFSQLAAIVASDGFLPRKLAQRGDRLSYSNGLITLAALAGLLVVFFHAETNALIPLYAIGVFVSFTIAQIGLVRRWGHIKGRHWKVNLAINGIGAVVSAVVALIFAVTKFTGGAWIIIVILPWFAWLSLAISRHYKEVRSQLHIDLALDRPVTHEVTSIVLISGIHRVVNNTLSFAKSIDTNVVAVYVGFDDASIERIQKQWKEWGSPCQLVTLKSQYRSLIGPISSFIRDIQKEKGKDSYIHILMPQFIMKKSWHNLLHNQSALILRTWLFLHKDVVITTVPFHLKK
ncbi:APC family permease [Sporolactobacillus shoreae]